jgi:hypothetical protein
MRSMTDEGESAATTPCLKALIRPALPGTFSRKRREKDCARRSCNSSTAVVSAQRRGISYLHGSCSAKTKAAAAV